MAQPLFQPGEQEKLRRHFGEDFCRRLIAAVDEYTGRWSLRELRFLPSYSANVVFTGLSPRYGEVVLKVGTPSPSFIAECAALREYGGRRFCRLYEAEEEKGVLLEERIRPGASLRQEHSRERRLDVFCSLYTGLHREPSDPAPYPAYLDWVTAVTRYMSGRADCRELAGYMRRAEELCLSLRRKYPAERLLHGDFHHDNIASDAGGGYRLIDPKGVIGDPVFEIGRFLLNEPYEEAADPAGEVDALLAGLSRRLGLPRRDLLELFFIELCMGECWSVEDGVGTVVEHTGRAAFLSALLDEI